MDDNLTTPESIVSNPKFERLAPLFDDQTDFVNFIGKLGELSLKYNAEASKERAKGNDQAIKAYTSAMDTKVKSVSALTRYIGQLGSNNAHMQAAAIAGIVNTTKAQIEAFTKLEQQESAELHSWYEKARGNAILKNGNTKEAGFWTGLVGGVIEEAEIDRDDVNIPWFVRNLEGKIAKGEIGDWRKMKDQLGDYEYAKLERLWAAAKTAEASRIGSIEVSEKLRDAAQGFAKLNANSTREEFAQAQSALEPLVGASIESISKGKTIEDLKNDATHFYDTAKVEKLEANADRYNAAAMDLLDSLGYTAKGASSGTAFSTDRWAPWRGSLVNDPKFQTWARERGFNDLGRAQVDENGKVLSYIRGEDDNRAIKAYGRALRLETLDSAGYDTEPVSVETKLPYASVRGGTITDTDGDEQTVIAVNRGGKQSLYVMSAEGAPVPLTNAPDLGINLNEIAWSGEPTAYEEIKNIKDDAQVARAYAAHLKDGSGTADEAAAPAPAEDWTVSFGTFKDSDSKLPHNIYAVSDGNSPTQYFMPNLATGKLVPTNPRGDAVFAFTLHVAPSRVAEFTGKDDAHATLAARLAEIDTSPDPAEDADTLFMADEEYAKVTPAKSAGTGDKFTVASAIKPVEVGNIDLYNRPRVKIEDNKTATVLSMSVGFADGEYLIPRVSEDGRILSEKDAIAEFRRTGKHLGKFKTADEATAYAKDLHTAQEAQLPRNDGPAAWTVIPKDTTTVAETRIGSDYGTTARDGTRRVRVQGGETYDVKDGDTVAPLKKEEEYERNKLNAEDRLVNRKALASDNERAQEIARTNLSEPQSLGEASSKAMGHPDQTPPKLDADAVLSPEEIEDLSPHEKLAYAARVKLAAQADVRNKQPDALPTADESQIGDRTARARDIMEKRIKLEERIVTAKAAVEAAAPDKRPALREKLTQYEDAADTLYNVLNTTYADEVKDIIKGTPKVKKSAGVSGPDGLNAFGGAAKPGEGFQATAGAAQREFADNQKPGTYDSGPVREKTKEALARQGVLSVVSNGTAAFVRPGTPAPSDKALTRANDVSPLALTGPPIADPNKAPTEKLAKDALRNAMKVKYVSPSMSAPKQVGVGDPKVGL